MMKQITVNLAYLLWREKRLARHEWPRQLGEWIGADVSRATQLLNGVDLTTEEQHRIADAVSLPEEDLLFKNLVMEEGVNILAENVNYLLATLARGEQQVFAEAIGVSEGTVSRWKAGQNISKEHRATIRDYFGLPSRKNLAVDPIFLSLEPLGLRQRKKWLHEHVDKLDPATLQDIFPALRRLLDQ